MADADWGDEVRVLAKALDQAGDVLDQVHPNLLARPTPCGDWDVAALADHLIAAPGKFLTMMRGGEPDWSAPAAHVGEGWGPAFRASGDDLIHAWHEGVGDAPVSADWQTAEVAVHTWDLATAIGARVDRLDQEVADRGLAFMRANLTADNRGPAFGAEQTASDDAGSYQRLAAYAGRTVR
ncbi:TIGR03086 family metal-binding protein [Nocardioides sp. YIM 152315]|uniref:TIGR03086 family metal-binding protein n=1 Tax=Nocardioides sp. YIM 152315 TaxID=3031760 RepID=UPI0023DCCBF8|nr:TIGR03086 family metal-binding protein [Nocardioides sp. YIM 152315]MDF1606383.1 TIGR03086 family metal-binding protein [Nocardioides sp. YIM 152315]